MKPDTKSTANGSGSAPAHHRIAGPVRVRLARGILATRPLTRTWTRRFSTSTRFPAPTAPDEMWTAYAQ